MTNAFVDIETTGLDPETDTILEVGMVITDETFWPIAKKSCIIQVHPSRLEMMNEAVKDMHTRNGLLEDVNSDLAVPLRQASHELCDYFDSYFENDEDPPPMGGSSVHFDRQFLAIELPDLERRFHYRNLDVSSVKELLKQAAPWIGAEYQAKFPLQAQLKRHRVLDDLDETLGELRFYLHCMFSREAPWISSDSVR